MILSVFYCSVLFYQALLTVSSPGVFVSVGFSLVNLCSYWLGLIWDEANVCAF